MSTSRQNCTFLIGQFRAEGHKGEGGGSAISLRNFFPILHHFETCLQVFVSEKTQKKIFYEFFSIFCDF